MSDNSFEVAAGNGRLYKLDPEKANAEQERLRVLREDKGHKWATPESAHSYDGFLMINQEYINWLQEGLNQANAPTVRMNWKAHIAKMQSGIPCMHIKGSWFGNGMPNLKDFVDAGGQVSSQKSKPKPAETPIFDEDEDIPF